MSHVRLFLGLVFVIAVLWSSPLQACQECFEYWDWQAQGWCAYCSYVYCGRFNCSVQYYAGLGTYYCSGDSGCFEYAGVEKGWCGPDDMGWQAQIVLPKRLDQTWRLAQVRVRAAPAVNATPRGSRTG